MKTLRTIVVCCAVALLVTVAAPIASADCCIDEFYQCKDDCELYGCPVTLSPAARQACIIGCHVACTYASSACLLTRGDEPCSGSGGPSEEHDFPPWPDESDIINYIEPDPLGGDPAWLRELGVNVPAAPACATTAAS